MNNIGTSLQYRCSFYLFSETSVYTTLVPALWIFDKRWNLKLQMKLACIVQRLCSQFWDDFWGKWKLTLALVRLAWPREPWRWRWAPPWRSWRSMPTLTPSNSSPAATRRGSSTVSEATRIGPGLPGVGWSQRDPGLPGADRSLKGLLDGKKWRAPKGKK